MYIGLEITGIANESQGFIIKEAVERSLLHLLPLCGDTLCVNVEVSLDEDLGGACALVDEEDELEYTIYLNQNILDDDVELFKTVCHECVHIKQYFNKELEHINQYRVVFNSKVYDTIVTKYEDRPWEQEARQTEESLYQENQQLFISLMRN